MFSWLVTPVNVLARESQTIFFFLETRFGGQKGRFIIGKYCNEIWKYIKCGPSFCDFFSLSDSGKESNLKSFRRHVTHINNKSMYRMVCVFDVCDIVYFGFKRNAWYHLNINSIFSLIMLTFWVAELTDVKKIIQKIVESMQMLTG